MVENISDAEIIINKDLAEKVIGLANRKATPHSPGVTIDPVVDQFLQGVKDRVPAADLKAQMGEDNYTIARLRVLGFVGAQQRARNW